MSNPTIAMLMRGASIIRRGWCKGASARDDDGQICNPESQRAVKWCCLGATRRAQAQSELAASDYWDSHWAHQRANGSLQQAIIDIYGDRDMGIATFNDEVASNVDAVIQVFRRAIAIEARRSLNGRRAYP